MARKILMTGAAGRVGQVLSRAWAETYDLTLVDVRPFPGPVPARFVQTDAFALKNLTELCRGFDTVVHLAISGNMHDDWDVVAPGNIGGARTVFQVACEANCRRVVFSSTIRILINPDSPYSLSKRWGELLAERTAAMTPLSIICLRLGAVLTRTDPAIFPGSEELSHVLTHRDLVALFTKAVEAPAAVKYGVFWGISANQPAQVDISETRRVLGYNPQDDAFQLAISSAHTPRGLWRAAKSRIKRWIKLWKS